MNPSRFCSSARALTLRKVTRTLIVIAGILLLPCALLAQVNQARISGTVADQSGGAIVGASVTVRNVQTGVTRTLTTDDAGAYSAPNLDPGTYEVRAEFKGFQTVIRQGLVLAVGQEARVDITLQPGAQTQTVTVTEALPLVETTTSTLSSQLTSEAITELPLNGRNFQNLISLSPGFVNSPGGGAGNQAGMGLRPGDQFFTLDGLNNYEWNQGATVINGYGLAGDASTILPIDAIQDFDIEQNPKAEFGWKPGVQVNIGLKSGTNSIHGSAYAFGRDGAWDALNFFQPPTLATPPLSFEQYGATAGGPIQKDKLFWFVGYEAQLLSLGITTPIAAPLDVAGTAKTSLVSACQALGAAKISALSARLAGLNPTTCAVSPVSSSFENVFAPNAGTQFPGDPTSVVPGGLLTMSDVNSEYNGLAKVDYHPNERNTLSGMFFLGQTAGTWDDNPSVEMSPWFESTLPVHNRVGSGSWTWVPNSTWVNEFKVGYTRELNPFLAADHNVNPDAPWGLSGGLPTGYAMNTGVTNPSFFGFPRISIQGFTLMGGNWPKFVGPDSNTEFLDHISYLRGKHAFKFGGEVTFAQINGGATSNAKGRLNFRNSGPTSALENFLEGNVGSGSQIFVGNPIRNVHNELYALFWQDDYRMTPRVTVNLGLRYELATVIQDANNEFGNFDPTLGLVQVGDGITSPYDGSHHNFSPRAGFAWDVFGNQKTVVRAGAGLLYEFVPYSAYAQLGGNSLGVGKVPTGAEICIAGVCTPGRGTIAAATVSPGLGALSSGWQNNGPNMPVFAAATVTCSDGSVPNTGPAQQEPSSGRSVSHMSRHGTSISSTVSQTISHLTLHILATTG